MPPTPCRRSATICPADRNMTNRQRVSGSRRIPVQTVKERYHCEAARYCLAMRRKKPSNGLASGFPENVRGCSYFKELLIKLARAERERFFARSKHQKQRNTGCTRKGYAASVSQLPLAYGCAIFPAFDAEERVKRIHSSATDDLFRGSLICKLLWGCRRR